MEIHSSIISVSFNVVLMMSARLMVKQKVAGVIVEYVLATISSDYGKLIVLPATFVLKTVV